MGMFDKLAFWRKTPDLPDVGEYAKDSGFRGPGGYGDSGFGKPNRDEFGAADKGFDQLGLGKGQDFMQDVEPGMPDVEPSYGGGPGRQQFMQQQPAQRRWERPQQAFGAPMQPMQPSSQVEMTMSRDFDVISSKLDTLKATLDGITQRLENLERLVQDKRRW